MEMKDVLETGQRLRNWGRWGPDDELGTLNCAVGSPVNPIALK